MKAKHIKIFSYFLFLLFSTSVAFSFPADTLDNQKQKNDSIASMEKFRQELSSKGQWIKIDSNDIDPDNKDGDQLDEDLNKEYVWRPDNVGYEWNPYEYGCWQNTSCGWMWVSYYDFGWTTCHYGRWWWSINLGWVWSPGYIWGPAWVYWGYYGDYYGWYPISPWCHWDYGYGYGYGHGHGHGYGHHNGGERHWTFVHNKDFTKTVNSNTIVPRDRNKDILKGSTIVNDINIQKNGIVTNEGPSKTGIEQSTGQKIGKYNVDALASGNKGRVNYGNENGRKNYSGTDNGRKSRTVENGYNGTKGNRTYDGSKYRGSKGRDNSTFGRTNGTKQRGYNGHSYNGNRGNSHSYNGSRGNHSYNGSHNSGNRSNNGSRGNHNSSSRGSSHHGRK